MCIFLRGQHCYVVTGIFVGRGQSKSSSEENEVVLWAETCFLYEIQVNTDLPVLPNQQLHIWIQQYEVIRDIPWHLFRLLTYLTFNMPWRANPWLDCWIVGCSPATCNLNYCSSLGNCADIFQPGIVLPFSQMNIEAFSVASWSRSLSCLTSMVVEAHLSPEQIH